MTGDGRPVTELIPNLNLIEVIPADAGIFDSNNYYKHCLRRDD